MPLIRKEMKLETVKQEPDKKGAIVGIGNVLQKDDGIGVKILKYLEASYEFPGHVELVDGGTAGVALQSEILGKDWLLIIDALAVPGEPGDVRLIDGKDTLSRPADLKMSPHQVSFFDLIQLMELNDQGAEDFSIIGVVPKDTGVGIDITPAVNDAMDDAIDLLFTCLKAKGVTPKQVKGQVTPDYWWQK